MTTIEACERLFTLMENQPIPRRIEPIDPYDALQARLAAEERVLSASVLDVSWLPTMMHHMAWMAATDAH